MKLESTMGCKSDPRDSSMQRKDSKENDCVTDRVSSTNQHGTTDSHVHSGVANNIPLSPVTDSICHPPTTPHGQGGLPHSATDPNFRGPRPHSAHHHRQIGRLLRVMGDGYCYSCGIALRQMGDQLSGEYEVRRALSTGDLPNSVKNT